MSNLTRLLLPSDHIIREVRACLNILILSDPSNSDGMKTFYVDMLGGYGPTTRDYFAVSDESEILGRLAIAEGDNW